MKVILIAVVILLSASMISNAIKIAGAPKEIQAQYYQQKADEQTEQDKVNVEKAQDKAASEAANKKQHEEYKKEANRILGTTGFWSASMKEKGIVITAVLGGKSMFTK
ncbi:hypothetical protein C9J21_18265 [Photobacterium phosphoreum]|uniref:hypothetical protein n=1 Tax=Photobacterium phosphoreum TaxID=659 RepID=UPI000D173F7E|nr:hypothetical protein [Photobacterium phosphoreum]PSW30832.1 hypothetical protein C9J21_18265 [Photobacterium phosphoreum]